MILIGLMVVQPGNRNAWKHGYYSLEQKNERKNVLLFMKKLFISHAVDSTI